MDRGGPESVYLALTYPSIAFHSPCADVEGGVFGCIDELPKMLICISFWSLPDLRFPSGLDDFWLASGSVRSILRTACFLMGVIDVGCHIICQKRQDWDIPRQAFPGTGIIPYHSQVNSGLLSPQPNH